MRHLFMAMIAVSVMLTHLSLPVVLAFGVDPCADRGDHDCPPLGDDCHDCARCSPQPAILAALPGIALHTIPTSTAHPVFVLDTRPPQAPAEPAVPVPRSLA